MKRAIGLGLSICIVVVATGLNGCAEMGARATPAERAQASCPFFSQKMLGAAAGGAAIGAVAGAASGGRNRSQNILLGALIGALVGGSVGKALDHKDCEAARVAMQQMASAPVGTQVAWANPESGNRGTQTPTAEATVDSQGQLCRSYHETVYLKNATERQQDGITCRDANGDWHAT
jgi:surface antigen